jgi:phosphoglycerate dehydrogenase-like enzyme
VGGEADRSDFISGPGISSAIDLSHRHLSDCTMGIVGVGEIGREIARRAKAFGMTVCGVDPVCRDVPGIIPQVWPTEKLDELLAASDFVVIAAPHTPETHKLFRRPQFERMRKGAVLINIGRGAIVDLADLTAALDEKLIAGAALDVFETEPLPADHPLWGMENVFITPHIAGTSPRIAERHTATLLENIRRFVAGQSPVTVVDKARWF